MNARRWTPVLLLVACASVAAAEPPSRTALHDEVMAQDAAMFAAFNAHDNDRLMSFFAEDVEFFHDKDGLVPYDRLRDGFKRIFANNTDLTRQLVPGTASVYPVPGYGAIQTGAHKFCHTENGKPDCGVFQFTNVWRNKEGRWQLTRVLSYAH